MAPTETDIRTLLASQSYSSSSLPQLEAYLAAQASGAAPYLADAVRTTVKLYQLFPEKANQSNTAHACMLAMLEYPHTDLLALSYMIPMDTLETEPLQTIVKCSDQLDACQFAEFWKTLAAIASSSDPVLAQMATRAVPKLQKSILSILALSYKQAPAAVVRAALNAQNVAHVASLQHEAVESVTPELVTFGASPDNTKRKRVYQEGVNFTAISSLMAKMGQ
jgi:hypothetical protein